MVYLKSVETLGKLIGLLFLFCLPLLYNKRNELTRPVMGTIFLVYMSVCLVCQINCVGGITQPTRMLKVIFGR